MDQPVSEPSVARHSSDATAAAEPPEEPPGTRVRSHGFRVVKNAEFSVELPIANSSRFVLQTGTPPSSKMGGTPASAQNAVKCCGCMRRNVFFENLRRAGRASTFQA